MEEKIVKLKAIVKNVMSGDTLLLQNLKPGKDGKPLQKELRLIALIAPKVKKYEGIDNDEAYGFEAKEYLRKLLINKEVNFYIEAKIQNKQFGSILLNDKDIAIDLLKNGFSKLNFSYAGQSLRPRIQGEYEAAQEEAKKAKKGVWGDQTEQLKHIRKIVEVENSKIAKEKKVVGIVDTVFNRNINLYSQQINGFLRVSPIYLQFPKQNMKDLTYFIETKIVGQEVTLTNFKEGISGLQAYITTATCDLQKELIKEGFAKLDFNCINEIDIIKYKELQGAMDHAKEEKHGIWSNIEEDSNPNITSSTKTENSYIGILQEIHSGDSYTIENIKTKERIRYFFPNLKAPMLGNSKNMTVDKPWAFEAKEFIRKNYIGKKVHVEQEFVKSFVDEQLKQERVKLFSSLVYENDNIAVKLIENGFATCQVPKQNEPFTKYLKEMNDAELKAKEKKLGVHSDKEKIIPKFNDFTQSKDKSKSKNIFEFVKDKKSIEAIPELILNGSRYKIRLANENTYIIFILDGVKCLQNDENVPHYSTYSNKALQFAKDNILQRDVFLQITNCDQKGIFHGSLTVNKQNFEKVLLQEGLAYCLSNQKKDLLALQNEAQKNKVGLWKDISHLSEQAGSTQLKIVSQKEKMRLSELISPRELYFASSTDKTLGQIEAFLQNLNISETQSLAQPIKNGTPCIAKWEEQWCRAKIFRQVKNSDKYFVKFIDYGNFDDVSSKNLKKLPNEIKDYQPQAIQSGFAYLNTPSIKHQIGETIAIEIRDQLFEKDLVVDYQYQVGNMKFAIVYVGDSKESLNEFLLKRGYAKLATDQEFPESIAKWREYNNNAQGSKLGIWKYDDEDEEEY